MEALIEDLCQASRRSDFLFGGNLKNKLPSFVQGRQDIEKLFNLKNSYFKVIANEGPKALFRGAGVNVVRGVAGAGVLSGNALL